MSEDRVITETNCNDRTKPIYESLKRLEEAYNKIDKKLEAKYDGLNSKMNWFYILTIATLLSVVANFIQGSVKWKNLEQEKVTNSIGR